MERRNEFDLEIVLQGLQRCRQDDESILLDEYIYAFKELCRYGWKYLKHVMYTSAPRGHK